MAWRNLWRNRRRTIVTLSSIVFGFLLAVIFTGVGDSTYSKMIDLAARMGGGHVTIQHTDYLGRPSLRRTVPGASALRQLALQDEQVRRVTARIIGQTMLAAGGKSYGAAFIAIDPRAEDASSFSLLEAIKQGALFSGPGGQGIVLGHKLAKNLGLKLGRKVVYTMTDKRGEIVTELARVSGILRTGSPSVDAGLCLLPIDSVRRVLGYGADEATQVAVFIEDQRRGAAVAARLRGRLPGDGHAAAVLWSESQPELAGFIAMKVGGTLFFELIIAVLVAAGIFNTLFVSVMERLREFGIMMAIGFSPRRLFALVMWESLWIGLLGLLLGAIVTAGPYYLLNTRGIDATAMVGQGGAEVAGVGIDPIMYVDIYPESLTLIAAAVLLATLLSGIYPAWRAGRVAPVEAIKLV